MGRGMKLAIVVQRYGADINGGAELHARYIAERLSAHADIGVLTTCARDYLSWRNDFPQGVTEVNGVRVERFPVSRERNLSDFARRSDQVFNAIHSLQDELNWLDSEGPVSRDLLSRLRAAGREFDFVMFFSARYHHAYHGARAVADRAVLVPTMERDPALGLALFRAGVPWRARHHVQLPRGTGPDSRRVGEPARPRRCRGRGVGDSVGCVA